MLKDRSCRRAKEWGLMGSFPQVGVGRWMFCSTCTVCRSEMMEQALVLYK